MREILLFIEDPRHEWMESLDLTDGGMKLFGNYYKASFEGSRKSLKTLMKSYIKNPKTPQIGFAIEKNKLWTNKKFWAYSDGKNFITRTKLEKTYKGMNNV